MSASGGSGAGPAAPPDWTGPGFAHVPLDVVFPLPPVKTAPGLGGKQGGVGTCPRRFLADVNAALRSLNWYAGYRGPAAPSAPTEVQAGVTARVVELVRFMHTAGVAIPPAREAFMELTRGRSVYDDKMTGANIARFSSASGVS